MAIEAQIIDNLQAAVVVINRDRHVEFVNAAAETLFGRSRRQLHGKVLPLPGEQQQIQICIDACFDDHSQFTLRELSFTQEVLLDLTISAIADQHGQPEWVVLEMNSTNRISQFMRDQIQTDKLNAFRMMMRSLAHEVKNPLGGLRGAAQLLSRELTDDAHQQLTGILTKEADRLSKLVDRIMGSRRELSLLPVNIHDVLEHVIGLLNVQSVPTITIVRQYDPALPEILLDREQMIQAVLNIALNAVQILQAQEGGTIGFCSQVERAFTIEQTRHRQVLKLQIYDSGPGVAEDIKEQIFDPLISSRVEGSGLGLAITHEIIQRHGGLIQLESLHKNTCFTIYLPYQ